MKRLPKVVRTNFVVTLKWAIIALPPRTLRIKKWDEVQHVTVE